MDDQTLQESWATPFIPTYRTVLRHGQYTLDAYLHGLFVAYHDHFRFSLGVPENPRDLQSVRVWKRCALSKLAHLMIRVHTKASAATKQSSPSSLQSNSSSSSPSSPPMHRPQQDTRCPVDVIDKRSPEPLASSGTPLRQPSDTQVSETESQRTTPVLSNSSAVIPAQASSINVKADSSAVGAKRARLSAVNQEKARRNFTAENQSLSQSNSPLLSSGP
ncbi:hypothetical protein ARMSODRAFT_974463 [Armillaria solidipes]|uniref:Uncharacterized protein n=1 Tax=Armillaria solidipes TaxID=1076256 RepID=A0A2H3BI90_9AGAR|nr:hypothetical protein ARMSODRAFT_974463 [Armillaria solidipes]